MKRFGIPLIVLGLSSFWTLPLHSQSIFTLNQSVRAYGLGQSCVADDFDPANAYCNPALIFSLHGAFATGGYGQLMPELVSDVRAYNIGVICGYGFTIAESTTLGIAAGLRYNGLQFGRHEIWDAYNVLVGHYEPYERYMSFTLSGGLNVRERYIFGFGLSVKPFKYDITTSWPELTRAGNKKTTAYDLGMFFKTIIDLPDGFTLAPAFGLSILNLGENKEYLSPLPEQLHVGIGLRLAGFGSARIDEILHRKTPVLTLAGNFEINREQILDKSTIYGYGFEVGLIQALFLRIGYYDHEDGHTEDITYGIGTGITYGRIRARFDYARVPQAEDLDYIDKYGGSVGVFF